jgi:cyclophilin family peptidyl-prolyl cis-trans isomerase
MTLSIRSRVAARVRGLRATRLLVPAIAALLLAPAPAAASVVVLVKTNLRKLDPSLPHKFYVVLYTGDLPFTSSNFLHYALNGLFRKSVFHRSVPNFAVQGGGFSYTDGAYGSVPTEDPIHFQPGRRSNIRGTLAMARLPITVARDLPTCEAYDAAADTATSQWFVNLTDNSSILDDVPHVRMKEDGKDAVDDEGRPLYTDCGTRGYSVFGKVLGDGMDVIDAIAALPRESGQLATDEAPEITQAFRSLPVLHDLDPGPFGNGCAQVLEPQLDEDSTPTIVCDSSCSDAQCIASIAARQAALRDQLPSELVKVNKVKTVPLTRGFDHMTLGRVKTQIRHAVTGGVSRVPVEVDSGFTTTEWIFSLGDTTWRAIDVRDLSYAGEVWDHKGKHKTILSFDPANADGLAQIVESRFGGLIRSAQALHANNFRGADYPDCADTEVGPGDACFTYDPVLTRVSNFRVTIPDPPEELFRVREDRKRNLFKIKASIPFEATFDVRISYFEMGGQVGTTKADRTVTTPGTYEFVLSGPIRRHHD